MKNTKLKEFLCKYNEIIKNEEYKNTDEVIEDAALTKYEDSDLLGNLICEHNNSIEEISK